MSKYKAGDKVTVLLCEDGANYLNTGRGRDQIIAHERAPEPIVRYANVYSYDVCGGYLNVGDAKIKCNDGCLGQIKVTITGNDFVVEKVG